VREWIAQIIGGTTSHLRGEETHVCSRVVDEERKNKERWDERDSWTSTPNQKNIPSC
jgi:hypothetical protein